MKRTQQKSKISNAIAILELLCLFALLITARATEARKYHILDLGTLWGDHTFAYGINDSEQIVGFSTNQYSSPARAFLWENGMMIDLGDLGGTITGAFSINNHGQITGVAKDSGGQNHVFLWETGVMIDLGNSLSNGGEDINDLGQIVDGSVRILNPDGTVINIGGYQAFGINNHTQVVGYYDAGGEIGNAYLWDNGTMLGLGTLGGQFSAAKKISNNSQVVGYSTNSSGHTHAFIWENGEMTDLGALDDDTLSIATSINDHGQVVGYSAKTFYEKRRPFLWERGKMTDLNALIDENLGFILYDAFDINNKGQIVGRYLINGLLRSFLITPAHEPISIDIKPGSYPNSINLKSRGVVPVAILTTYRFDVSLVDPDTVTFAGAEPVRWNFEDIDGDGYIDMVLHFNTKDLTLDSDCTEATLTGMTLDKVYIEGTDSVNIVPKGKKK